MNPIRPQEDAPMIVQPKADPVLAVIDFEPGRVTLGPIDFIRYALYSLLIVAMAATAAYLVASQGPDVYGARSEILFERRTEQSTGFLRQDRNLTTQLVTLRTRAVLGPVASANAMAVDGLSKKLTVGIVDSSEVIRIQVNDRSAARAQELVAEISKQYLSRVDAAAPGETQRLLETDLGKISRDIDRLSARSAQLERARLDRASNANPTPVPTPAQTLTDAEIKSLLDQRTDVNARLEAARIDFINRPRVAQITKPYKLDDPISPKPLNAAAAGGLAGLVIAAIAVAVLARRHGQSARIT